MEEYVIGVMSISQQHADISAPVEDEFIGVVMLSSLSPEYKPIIMALENLEAKIISNLRFKNQCNKPMTKDSESNTDHSVVYSLIS
jgi:hypothetical protein